MTRYYRVIKEHPTWEIGAILKQKDQANENDIRNYTAISDVWDKELGKGVDVSGWWEGGTLVENQTEWFERVYPIGEVSKMLFGNKKQAQAAAAALYKGDK